MERIEVTKYLQRTIALFAVPLLAIFLSSCSSQSNTESSNQSSSDTGSQSLSEAFGSDITAGSKPNCNALNNVVSATTYQELEAKASESKKITNSEDALAFVRANSISVDDLMAKYDEELIDVILKDFGASLFSTLIYQEASEQQQNIWKEEWKDLSLTSCGLADKDIAVKRSLETIVNDFKRVSALAGSVPTTLWYPDNFTEFDSNTAYEYSSGSCDSWPCYNVTLISKVSCSNLYAEVTLYDSSGSNVGYTNDTAVSVQPFQKVKLRFDIVDKGVETGRLTKVSCY
jgi:hypothetical protein